MTGPVRAYCWWDRDADAAGRRIRKDVRIAAHEIWEEACRRTYAVLRDRTQAADLMERSVAQISRYLDRLGAPPSSCKHGLLMVAFCRALRREAATLRRLELVGGSSELSDRVVDDGWIRQLNTRLELERLIRQLSQRNGQILTLRAAGFEWDEISRLLGASVAALRNAYWREIRKIRELISRQPVVKS
jgi:DNA-directed RNA polymerase specialized sigma24 family protein